MRCLNIMGFDVSFDAMQILWPPAYTSGRRLQALGNWKATKIHFTIGLGWYLGISRQRLFRIYETLYSDRYR